MGGLADRAWFREILLSDAVDEGGDRGAAVHAAALMRSFGIVVDEVLIEDGLHLLQRLVAPGSAFSKLTLQIGYEPFGIG